MNLGADHALQAHEVDPLPTDNRSQVAHQRLAHFWELEKKESIALGRRPHINRALFNSMKREFAISQSYFFFYAVVTLIQPFFVTALLTYVTSGSVRER